ncbi:MAG TPA: indolepyruvate oxidoreductase subunit beta [Bacillota bacterium]|nr:indolepyruvate oxidoreductase subunit beta [Bacillota bacterium]
MTGNIMICGVGGQGSLLASRILGHVAQSLGCDVKVSEVHGMAQRGGSVVTYVRYSDEGKVASPVICRGEADVLLSFEQLEGARWIEYLKKDGLLIVNTQQILPMPVVLGAAEYPTDLIEKIKSRGINTVAFDALGAARELGNEKVVNVILIGIFAKHSEVPVGLFTDAVRECVPERLRELNLKAFEAGYNI